MSTIYDREPKPTVPEVTTPSPTPPYPTPPSTAAFTADDINKRHLENRPSGMPESDWQKYRESMTPAPSPEPSTEPRTEPVEPSTEPETLPEASSVSYTQENKVELNFDGASPTNGNLQMLSRDDVLKDLESHSTFYDEDGAKRLPSDDFKKPLEKPAGMPEADWAKYKDYLESKEVPDGLTKDDGAVMLGNGGHSLEDVLNSIDASSGSSSNFGKDELSGDSEQKRPMEKPSGMPEADWQKYKESMERESHNPEHYDGAHSAAEAAGVETAHAVQSEPPMHGEQSAHNEFAAHAAMDIADTTVAVADNTHHVSLVDAIAEHEHKVPGSGKVLDTAIKGAEVGLHAVG